ncbi:MAG: [protein-PII] uridylyltransferase [Rhodospirillales bacterium]|nr:[protein-PII] uridylyltransferase [Rhodospirillales bacterium]
MTGLPPVKLLKTLRENKISGSEFANQYSEAMDKHLIATAKELLPAEDIALIATGGYGREELCPASDIDLLFLVPPNTPKSLEKAIEKTLYRIWDNKIKVGHAVRTAHECVSVMNKDPRVMAALLDARLIWGQRALFLALQDALNRARTSKNISKFITLKLTERDQRHKRYEDSRYVLEPNIKEGKGGLRDYQTLLWITRLAYNARTPAALREENILTRRECTRVEKALDFLLTVRCHLHDIAGRGEERLHFDIQPELAKRLGYNDRNNARAVERFMKHYFLVTRDIGDLTRIICAAIEEDESAKTRLFPGSAQSYMGFEVRGNRLNFSPSQDIAGHPSEIMRFFRVAQETGHDIHPKALRAISKNINVIDQKFAVTPLNNNIFIEILTAKNNAGLTLRRMNEAGILERFIPEFRKIIALMQFDRYHIFTVDEHTLRAIDTLRKIENGDLRDETSLASALIHTIENRRALYVAILLHDICKGRNGDHSHLGAELALSLCPRLGLTDEETRLVSWLVFEHLFMSEIAFKRDLEDPKTLEDFLFRIYGLERLKLLTILTTADIIAVGPGRWTGWKAKLIEALYYMAESAITGKKNFASSSTLAAIPADLAPNETRIDFTQDEDKHVTIISVYTQDRAGLFALITGALAQAEINIIEARINTLDDGRVADIFTVQNFSGKPVLKPHRQNAIRKKISQALKHETSIIPVMSPQRPTPSKKDAAFDVPTGVTIKNEASHNYSVIETYGRDRPGLLHDLARIIREHGGIVKSAKANTFGLKALDVFYIQSETGHKIQNEKTLEKLRAELQKTLVPKDK